MGRRSHIPGVAGDHAFTNGNVANAAIHKQPDHVFHHSRGGDDPPLGKGCGPGPENDIGLDEYARTGTGLRQTPEMVAAAAIDEDVDVVGLSMLSGGHMALAPRVVELLRAEGSEIPVVVGGIIPEQDIAKLTDAGVASVLHPGASADEVAESVRSAAEHA